MDSIKLTIKGIEGLSKRNLISIGKPKEHLELALLFKKENYKKFRDSPLKILIRKKANEIVICGSIRKWYFGKHVPKNLTRSDYKSCINLIADKLGISKKRLWLCTVTKMEVSLSMRLKPENRFMLLSFVEYKNFEKIRYGYNSLAFVGDSYGIKMYDALVKNLNEIKYTKTVNGIEKVKVVPKKKRAEILSRQFILRCELDINRINKMDLFFRKSVNCPMDIFRLWEKIYTSFREKLKDVTCYAINESLQKEFDQMDFSQSALIANLKDKGVKEFKKFLQEVTICIFGVEKMYCVASFLKSGKPRFVAKQFLNKILQDYKKTENDQEIMLNAFDRTLLQIV